MRHGNTSNTESVGIGIKKSYLKCTYCHKDGHLKESCFKLIGYSPKGRGRGRFTSKQANSQAAKSQAMHVTTSIGTIPSTNNFTSSSHIAVSTQT